MTGSVVRRDGLREAEGWLKVETAKHEADVIRGGCVCGFSVWSAEHVAVAAFREVARRLDAVPDVPPTEARTLGHGHTEPRTKCRECRRKGGGGGQYAPHYVAPLRIRPPVPDVPPDLSAVNPLAPPSGEPMGGLDPATLNELADLIRGDGFVSLSVRYGAAARILRAGWSRVDADPPAVTREALVQAMYAASVDGDTYVRDLDRLADALLSSGVLVAADDVRARALRPFEELFSGGPDTACRTTWPDGIECVEVPMADLRAAFDRPKEAL